MPQGFPVGVRPRSADPESYAVAVTDTVAAAMAAVAPSWDLAKRAIVRLTSKSQPCHEGDGQASSRARSHSSPRKHSRRASERARATRAGRRHSRWRMTMTSEKKRRVDTRLHFNLAALGPCASGKGWVILRYAPCRATRRAETRDSGPFGPVATLPPSLLLSLFSSAIKIKLCPITPRAWERGRRGEAWKARDRERTGL